MISYGDRVLQTSITSGTGSLSLIAAPTGWRSFVAAVGNGKKVSYHIDDGTSWESGIGTITSGTPDILSRDQVLESSNSNALVNFGANTKNVRLALLSKTFPSRDENLNFTEGYTSSVSGTNTHAVTLDPEPEDYSDGMEVSYFAPNQNSAAVNININSLGNKELTINGSSLTSGLITSGQLIKATYRASSGKFYWNNPPLIQTVMRNHIDGYQFSTAGASSTFAISAGQAADSGNAVYITTAGSISKTTAAWAVGSGNGGLDTGSIVNNTWYHIYAIRRPDTGVVDIIFSTNASSPSLPANYTQYRYLNSRKTNGSGNWHKIRQRGDENWWDDTPALDIDDSNPGTSSVLKTLPSVPTGREVVAIFNGGLSSGNTTSAVLLFSDPTTTPESPSLTASPLASGALTASVAAAVGSSHAEHRIRTNTSAQIRYRATATAADILVKAAVKGWIDRRGKE